MGTKQRTRPTPPGFRDGQPFGKECLYFAEFGIKRMAVRVLVAFCAAHLAEGRPLSAPEIQAGTADSDDPAKSVNSYTAQLERAGLIERAGRVEGTRTVTWRPTRRGLRLLNLEPRKVAV